MVQDYHFSCGNSFQLSCFIRKTFRLYRRCMLCGCLRHYVIYGSCLCFCFVYARHSASYGSDKLYLVEKAKNKKVEMQDLSLKKRIATFLALIIIHVILYLLLSKSNASSTFFDAFFFSSSLISCILLAKKKKEAYFIIMLSGIAGTLLWLSQFILNGTGISVLLLNFFTFINSLRGIKIQNSNFQEK